MDFMMTITPDAGQDATFVIVNFSAPHWPAAGVLGLKLYDQFGIKGQHVIMPAKKEGTLNAAMLPSAKGNRDQHYANMNYYNTKGDPAISMKGKFWQIDAEIHDHFLEMLPPRYVTFGWFMLENLTDNVALYFTRFDNDYWCGYCTRAEANDMRRAMGERSE